MGGGGAPRPYASSEWKGGCIGREVWFGLVWLAPGPWPHRLMVSKGLRHGNAKNFLAPRSYLSPWRLPAMGIVPCCDLRHRGFGTLRESHQQPLTRRFTVRPLDQPFRSVRLGEEGGGGLAGTPPPPWVPLCSPPKAGQRFSGLIPLGTEGAEAKFWLSTSNIGREEEWGVKGAGGVAQGCTRGNLLGIAPTAAHSIRGSPVQQAWGGGGACCHPRPRRSCGGRRPRKGAGVRPN